MDCCLFGFSFCVYLLPLFGAVLCICLYWVSSLTSNVSRSIRFLILSSFVCLTLCHHKCLCSVTQISMSNQTVSRTIQCRVLPEALLCWQCIIDICSLDSFFFFFFPVSFTFIWWWFYLGWYFCYLYMSRYAKQTQNPCHRCITDIVSFSITTAVVLLQDESRLIWHDLLLTNLCWQF